MYGFSNLGMQWQWQNKRNEIESQASIYYRADLRFISGCSFLTNYNGKFMYCFARFTDNQLTTILVLPMSLDARGDVVLDESNNRK